MKKILEVAFALLVSTFFSAMLAFAQTTDSGTTSTPPPSQTTSTPPPQTSSTPPPSSQTQPPPTGSQDQFSPPPGALGGSQQYPTPPSGGYTPGFNNYGPSGSLNSPPYSGSDSSQYQNQRYQYGKPYSSNSGDNMPQTQGGQGSQQNQNGNWQQQQQSSEKQQQRESDRQQQMMLKQLKSMVKPLQANVAAVTKTRNTLQKSGLALSSDCQEALSNAGTIVSAIQSGNISGDSSPDQGDVADAMESLGECRMMAQRLTQAPTIMKTLQRNIDRRKKKGEDLSDVEESWSTLQSDYNTLKSGNFSNDDVDTFFEDAQDVGSSLGFNSASFFNGGVSPQAGGGFQKNGIQGGGQGQPQGPQNSNFPAGNIGAGIVGAVQDIGGFFGKLFR